MIDKNKSYKDIVSFLNQKYPISLSEKWDNSGLFIPPNREAISKIVMTLSLTESAIEKAIIQKANFIISHHPLTLIDFKNIDPKTREGYLLIKLIKNGIGLYIAHTNFDCHAKGLNYYLGKAIGLNKMKPLEPINEGKNGLGKVGVLKKAENLSEFMKRVKELIGDKSIEMTYPIEDIIIKRVSICGGSGKHLLSLAIKKSDIYLTGDLSYHDFEKAAYCKFPLGNISHFHSEKLGFLGWSKMLSKRFNIDVDFLEEEGIYSTVI